MYPNAVHASHSDGIIPRSWNDFETWPFFSASTSFVIPGAGDASKDGRREGSFAGSGAVGFLCVEVVFFALFDRVSSSLCESTSSFLLFMKDMSGILEYAHCQVVLVYHWNLGTRNNSALALIDKTR